MREGAREGQHREHQAGRLHRQAQLVGIERGLADAGARPDQREQPQPEERRADRGEDPARRAPQPTDLQKAGAPGADTDQDPTVVRPAS